jgi:gluconolactonase
LPFAARRLPECTCTRRNKQLAYVSTGKELPTNVAFGYGDDANLLYVTSGKSLYSIRMVKKGYHLKG